jgi:hypothetical protein
MKFVTKTTYLDFLECQKNAWIKLNKPELYSLFEPSDFEKGLMQQGYTVEMVAQKLFQEGIRLGSSDTEHAILSTRQYIAKQYPVLFQPTFITDSFLARVDVLKYNEQSSAWDIYEIKGKSSADETSTDKDDDKDIKDVAFQAIVLRKQNIIIGKSFIIRLNKTYTRNNELDIKQLFEFEDITEKVLEVERDTRLEMDEAKNVLLQDDERIASCLCIYKGRRAQCSSFSYSHPHIPEYSVHDIARIKGKKLESLVDACIFDIDDIPLSFQLTDIQKNQVISHQQREGFVNKASIADEMRKLIFPLYFLDYETYAPAIPLFADFRPYSRIPFQFSLHVLQDLHSTPIHSEYLHEFNSDPSTSIIAQLNRRIGPKGSVIVWNKTFEQTINKELAERHQEFSEFLYDLNNRCYDLRDIFNKQYYVHPSFRGKTSLKSVLPVLVPDLSYKGLEIKEGGAASEKWHEMIFGDLSLVEKQKIAQDLKQYCYLDTFAMYEILKILMSASNHTYFEKHQAMPKKEDLL